MHHLSAWIQGYQQFRDKYASAQNPLLPQLAAQGQKPKAMVIACCDARVDPALLLQCHPGDLFVVRNIANLVPPYQKDESYHSISAALEFGIRYLEVAHLIILGHSNCGGIEAFLNPSRLQGSDFIQSWLEIIDVPVEARTSSEVCAKASLLCSRQNALTFPWLKAKLEEKRLTLHLWFFDIQTALLSAWRPEHDTFCPISLPC